MPSNNGAYFTAVQAPLEIRPGEYPTPGERQVVVKSHALAINPCDYAMQRMGPAFFKWLKLPCVFGEDVAGEVVEVGPGVTTLKVGDRVTGVTYTAFQEYIAIEEYFVVPIPASLPYEEAAVLPLAATVAATGLFGKEYLNLQLPSIGGAKPTGETVLIWGASTSVGCNAVQLAAAAGYEVIATASPKNFEQAKKLGASQVFDYNSPTVESDLIAAFKGKKTPGAFCNGGPAPPTHPPVIKACAAVVAATEGRKFLALSMALMPGSKVPDGIDSKFIQGFQTDVELATAIFGDYLPKALEKGSYQVKPDAEVVGKGLESIQGAMDTLTKGVSAKKLVVTL